MTKLKLLLTVIALIIFGAGGFVGYRYLIKKPAPPTDGNGTTEPTAEELMLKECADVKPVIEGWKTFCTKEVGFAFDYPKEWEFTYFREVDDVNRSYYIGSVDPTGELDTTYVSFGLDPIKYKVDSFVGFAFTKYEIKGGKYILHHRGEKYGKASVTVEPASVVSTVNSGKALILSENEVKKIDDLFSPVGNNIPERRAYLNVSMTGFEGMVFVFSNPVSPEANHFDQMISTFRNLND